MRFVIDVTYARMWNKIKIDLDRGRISEEAYKILKGRNLVVPEELSNARAMKLFRTVVETLGGTMSTLTFDKKGPLKKPQEHIPRLILGLDWESAFTEIANWVEEGEEFEKKFKDSPLAARIEQSLENQLRGLHALTVRSGNNQNTPYLEQLMNTMNFKFDKPRLGAASDRSLENIDRLLTLDNESWKAGYRNRLYRAALAQVEHDAKRGGHIRGDTVEKPMEPAKPPLQTLEQARRRPRLKPKDETGARLELKPAKSVKELSEAKRIRQHFEEIRKIHEIVKILELQRRIEEKEREGK